jgi:hypothetical protein
MPQRYADVVEDGRERQLFLPAFALPVTPQIEAQGGQAGLAQTAGQAGEEPTLFARDSTAVHQDDSVAGWFGWCDHCSGKVKAVEGAESDLLLGRSHLQQHKDGSASVEVSTMARRGEVLVPAPRPNDGNCIDYGVTGPRCRSPVNKVVVRC